MRHYLTFISLVILMLSLYACSVKKHMPEDALLYRGGTVNLIDSVNIKDKNTLQDELEDVLYPEPNSKFLGMYPGLHFYYEGQKEHPGFINRFFNKKIGEKPAYLSDVDLDNTADLLQNRLENNGFFYSHIDSSVKRDSAHKTARIQYDVKAGNPYKMNSYQIEKDSADVDTLAIYDLMNRSMDESLLKKDQRFNLKQFKKERERLEKYLKGHGYYYFDDDFLLFEADTNQYDTKKFDLFLNLKPGTPEESKVPFVLDSVQVYANVVNDSVEGKQDTVRVNKVDIIQGKDLYFKPKRLRPFVLLEPGQTFNPEASKFTGRRLSSIGNYKFVNIYYQPIDSIPDEDGHRHLKSVITLSPLPKNGIQVDFRGVTKSNDFTGPGVNLTYTNRNIFKGGENLKVKGSFGYEKQFYKGNKRGSSSLHLGLESSLLFPRLLFPGHYDHVFRYAIPKTKVKAGIDYLNRSHLYSLNSFSTSFGYIWEQNRFVTHRFTPISIDYVKLGHTSPQFESILNDNPFLRRSFEQQFIAGSKYSFTYSELGEKEKRGKLYFQFNFDIAGNTVDLFGKRQNNGTKKFLGLEYAQYVKGDIDLSYHYDLGHSGQTLVGHVFAGLGIPYGNSKSLPFVKQYFSGGPYSVRAFHIRSLGPGTYQPDEGSYSYFDQAGDIRLEGNIEYRFPIISVLKGAVFADAGNVWLQKKNDELPGGKFSSNFYNEFGIGAGFGLRIDVQGFVIRFDLASKLKRPANNWNFEYKEPIFNFAIGYPF